MILSIHFIAGAAAISTITNPFLGIISAFLSHFLLDILPHQEYSILNIRHGQWQDAFTDFLKISLDLSFGFLIVILFAKNLFLGLLGGFVALVPDGITFLSFVYPKNKLFGQIESFQDSRLHIDSVENYKIKNNPDKRFLAFLTLLEQLAIILTAIFFLVKSS